MAWGVNRGVNRDVNRGVNRDVTRGVNTTALLGISVARRVLPALPLLVVIWSLATANLALFIGHESYSLVGDGL